MARYNQKRHLILNTEEDLQAMFDISHHLAIIKAARFLRAYFPKDHETLNAIIEHAICHLLAIKTDFLDKTL